jgi:hypothetical protein
MIHRFCTLLLATLALAGAYQVSAAAQPALFLVCELPDRSDLFIVIDNFDGMGGAMKQCVHYWQGRPRGVTSDPAN